MFSPVHPKDDASIGRVLRNDLLRLGWPIGTQDVRRTVDVEQSLGVVLGQIGHSGTAQDKCGPFPSR